MTLLHRTMSILSEDQGLTRKRAANFAVQVCDFYVAIGTKLTYTQTGYNSQDYARNAVKVVVDIDKNELDKDTMHVDFKIQSDAEIYFLSSKNHRETGIRST